jgi:hypothetical protein
VTFFLPCLPAPSIDGAADLGRIGLWRPAALRSGPAQEVSHLSFSSSGCLVASGLSKKFGPIHLEGVRRCWEGPISDRMVARQSRMAKVPDKLTWALPCGVGCIWDYELDVRVLGVSGSTTQFMRFRPVPARHTNGSRAFLSQ